MGEDTPPDPPPPGFDPCGDCELGMPDSVLGQIQFNIGGFQKFEGILPEVLGIPGSYSGWIFRVPPPGDIIMSVNFCVGGVDVFTASCAADPACFPVGRNVNIPHTGCFPIISSDSIDGDLTFTVS